MSASLALRKPWTTSGGTQASCPPAREPAVLGAQPHGQLAFEDVEEVRVVLMHVQVRALHPRAEARQRRVQRIAVGQDLYAASRLVADDSPPPGGNTVRAMSWRLVCASVSTVDRVPNRRTPVSAH